MNEFLLAIYCCAYTIQWHHLDSTLRGGARGSSLFWLDFSALDLGLSRSIPRATCFLFKMYGCVNVCVRTYNPTSIGSLFLFSFCFQPWLWFHLPLATCVELHPKFLCHLWRSNPEFGIGAHQISLCSTPTHTPFWSMCKRHYWFPSKLASVPEALKTSNHWRSLLCEVVPLSTTAPWRLSSLPAQYLSISSCRACWTEETHRMWIPPRTRSRIQRLLWRAWKKSIGPVTSIP